MQPYHPEESGLPGDAAARRGRPHLLLDAHIDEIGLTVTHIEDNGFLRVPDRQAAWTADC